MAEHSLPTITIEIPAGENFDTYNDFGALFSQDFRNSLASQAIELAWTANPTLSPRDIWASGFSGGHDEAALGAIDAQKLGRESAAAGADYDDSDPAQTGFEGDDSNQQNIVEREIHMLRQQKLTIARNLEDASLADGLTQETRERAATNLASLDQQIKELKSQQQRSALPVYYATLLENIRHDDAEDNPLSYMGDVPGKGSLALYDGKAITADPDLQVSYKSSAQIRIAGYGMAIMRHALAVVEFDFTD